MRQPLLPLLMLTAVALSSSNLIQDSRGQDYDNKFFTKNKDLLNKVLCNDKTSEVDPETIALCNKLKLIDNNKYMKMFDAIRDTNDNGKGFRHNYPRQLNRLQRFLYERGKRDDEEVFDENDYKTKPNPEYNNDLNEYGFNEIIINNNDNPNIYDAVVASTNPLLILKIRLACLSNTLETKSLVNSDGEIKLRDHNVDNLIPDVLDREYQSQPRVLNDDSNWDPSLETQSHFGEPPVAFKSLPSKKRIFSMWSRLQSLSPKGHELHHRRYMHAYYGGLPNTGGGSGMSAETRAMARPPGSPLRWG